MLASYVYLIGCVLLLLFWLAIFGFRKDLRQEMLMGSVLAIPFAFTAVRFIPEYWVPQTLFNLTSILGGGIEDMLYAFCSGGIAAVIYELIERKRVYKMLTNHKTHLALHASVFSSFFIFDHIFPGYTIYTMSVILAIGAMTMVVARRDLQKQMLFSMAYFSVFYFSLFIFLDTYLGLLNWYNIVDSTLRFIAGIPIGELTFVVSASAYWSILFEYVRGYRVKQHWYSLPD